MLYWIAPYLTELWGPFRLFSSHMMLLAAGTLTGGLVIWSLLPRLWNRLPTDRGKRLAADGGQVSAGKPTGAGLLLALLLVPVIALFVPMGIWEFGTVVFLYLSMLFGYLDDSSSLPWGEFKKGALDLAVALGACFGSGLALFLR
ncbi:MAG TPA: phospho-N-acetylmuramoyl-pentapeptide-transferase, partial [Kiritimatiellia bacterium]|nr:phospho-N-acetylmuramoyl-pentapeptide-transferase [Kiritimatiellia bacterium]